MVPNKTQNKINISKLGGKQFNTHTQNIIIPLSQIPLHNFKQFISFPSKLQK